MIRVLLALMAAAPGLAAQIPDFDLPFTVPQLESTAVHDSNDAAAHYNLALGYWQRERFDDAEAQFRLAMRLDADFAPSYLGLFAMVHQHWPDLWTDPRQLPPDVRKKADEVDPMVRQAFVTDPMLDLAPLEVAEPWVRFWPGFRDLLDGDYASAYAILSRELQRYPPRDSTIDDRLLWHGIAAEHLHLDSIARIDFQHLVDVAQSLERSTRGLGGRVPLRTADFEYLLARTLVRLGKTPEAVRYFHEALTADAGLYAAHSRLAEIAEAGEDWDDAIAERRAAVDVSPGNGRLLVYLGATLANAGRPSEAETVLRQAVSEDSRNFRAEYVLGVVEMKLGKQGEARAALTAALALTPSRFATILEDSKRRLQTLAQ